MSKKKKPLNKKKEKKTKLILDAWILSNLGVLSLTTRGLCHHVVPD
jgi:hypothetical protein